MDDLIHRLNALANFEHDDVEIGFEAAERIIDLTLEINHLRAELAAYRTALKNIQAQVLTTGFVYQIAEAALTRKGEGE